MNSISTGKKVLIFVTLAIYIVHLVFNGLSATGGPGNKLFPNSVSNISKRFQLEITPVGATFSIWGAIFTYQLVWMIYTTTTVCRNSLPSTNILSCKFYIAFIVNILFITTWLFVWARELATASLVVILLGQVFLNTAIGFALRDLRVFLDDQKILNKTKVDVWCQRFLVQNGLLFYATWTTVASLINVAVAMAYVGDVSVHTAGLVSLSILAVLALVWFVLESFVISEYTEYTFTVYITLIIANSGIYAANNKSNGNEVVRDLSLALVIVSAVLLVVRIIIISVRHRKKSSSEQVNY